MDPAKRALESCETCESVGSVAPCQTAISRGPVSTENPRDTRCSLDTRRTTAGRGAADRFSFLVAEDDDCK